MRAIVEDVVHRARNENLNEAHRRTKQVLFSNIALKRLHTEITPRFNDMGLAAGFTRIEKVGRRKSDKAEMAMIELVGNNYERMANEDLDERLEAIGRPSFW